MPVTYPEWPNAIKAGLQPFYFCTIIVSMALSLEGVSTIQRALDAEVKMTAVSTHARGFEEAIYPGRRRSEEKKDNAKRPSLRMAFLLN